MKLGKRGDEESSGEVAQYEMTGMFWADATVTIARASLERAGPTMTCGCDVCSSSHRTMCLVATSELL
eukprot:6177257-Pleurochrysis_carterae.AAC.1